MDEIEGLEYSDYRFQHNYNRVEQAARRLSKKGGTYSLSLSFDKKEGLKSNYSVPDEDAAMEFALAIADFARPDSPYNVDHWLAFLRRIAPEHHAQSFDKMSQELERIKRGTIAIIVHGHRITDEQAYTIMAERSVFASDIDALRHDMQLARHGPMRELMWQAYHNYCLGLWDFLQTLHAFRKKHGIRPPRVKRVNKCIYCTTTSGEFIHVEHTIPECLGNQESFLPTGYVCSKCKEALDRLEDGIHEMLPFSVAILTTRLGNKKGKLPILRSPEFRAERKSPNKIVFTGDSRTAQLKEERLPEGGFRLNLNLTGRFDVHKIARMLFKAALGAIALERGRDVVLHPRFDEVRRYIIAGGTFPNKLMVFKNAQPAAQMHATFQEFDGVPVVAFTVLGWRFALALGEHPKIEPHKTLSPLVVVFDLSAERQDQATDTST